MKGMCIFMIMVLKKNNIVFIAAIVILSLALIGINNVFAKKDTNEPSVTDLQTPQPTESAVGSLGKGRKVIIDPGHGGEDPGAVSNFNSDIHEKNINLYIGTTVKDLLEKDGYTVIMTRTEDKLEYDPETAKGETMMRKQDLQRRKKIMDESMADIVVSIHLNKYPDEKVKGIQTFFVKESPSSKKLAECLQNSLVKNIDPENKRVALVKKDDIIITKNCKTTTAIVECGFLSNREEEAKLKEKSHQDKLAQAIKLGIDSYFEE